MSEFLLTPLLLIAALGIAIGIIPGIVALIRLIFSKEGYLPYYFYLTAILAPIALIITGRNLFYSIDENDLENLEPSIVAQVPIYILVLSRTNSALIAFSACQRILKLILNPREKSLGTISLIVAFLFFCLTNILFPALFSSHPSFTHEYFYLTLVGLAALLFSSGEDVIAARSVRNSLLFLFIFSLGAAYWNPSLTFYNNYIGLIPGLTYRYAGLMPHPNMLGITLVLYLSCLLSLPYANRWGNLFAWVIGCTSLVLTQSKTSWIACIICLSCISYYIHGELIKQHLFNTKKPIFPAAIILIVMITASFVSAIVLFGDIGSKINLFFSSKAGSELLTMTGRTQIWAVAVNEWHNSPLFGYGLTIWNDAHRAKIGMSYAVSAHSQFYQTLSSAGIFGVAGLFIYAPTLLWFAIKTARVSSGLSLALFAIMLIRSFSEALEIQTYDITHLLLLMTIGANLNTTKPQKLFKL